MHVLLLFESYKSNFWEKNSLENACSQIFPIRSLKHQLIKPNRHPENIRLNQTATKKQRQT